MNPAFNVFLVCPNCNHEINVFSQLPGKELTVLLKKSKVKKA